MKLEELSNKINAIIENEKQLGKQTALNGMFLKCIIMYMLGKQDGVKQIEMINNQINEIYKEYLGE